MIQLAALCPGELCQQSYWAHFLGWRRKKIEKGKIRIKDRKKVSGGKKRQKKLQVKYQDIAKAGKGGDEGSFGAFCLSQWSYRNSQDNDVKARWYCSALWGPTRGLQKSFVRGVKLYFFLSVSLY